MTNESESEQADASPRASAPAAPSNPPTPFTASLDQPVTALAPAPDEPEPEPEEDAGDGRAWYIIQTYSGYENKVKTNLDQRVKQMDMAGSIFNVVIPTEDEIEIRDGQRKTVSRKLFPGYVLVQMAMEDEPWSLVRNTPGVTGFAGGNEEERALPPSLDDEEVARILRQMDTATPRINIGFAVGESVRVTDGPFIDFVGQVDDINLDKGKVRVMVSMFGRETPVELDFLQVEKQ
ncbi:MAG: transcription termination/antitermination protein NusG [Chloroflexi bacterium]|nr:transcription termination/antitermination protein NusG [Chloroflexota bacterium]